MCLEKDQRIQYIEEQLDVERERLTSLLDHLVGKPLEEDEDEGEMKNIKPSKSWAAQKLRLIERSKREYAEKVADAQKEARK